MKILNVSFVWNVPNSLSLLRIVLVPAFVVLYLCGRDYWAFAVLLLSALSDTLDGFIARRFDQITDCGKLLDPIADKLTQVAVIVCLTVRHPQLLPLTVICFAKESCQAIGSTMLLRRGVAVHGSRWFGKLATVIFYVCMAAIVVLDKVQDAAPDWLIRTAVGVGGVAMIGAFIGYSRMFMQLSREEKAARAAKAVAETEKQ